MNADLIKQRLAELQSKGKGGNKEFDKLFWKPKVGEQTIRIVPMKSNKDYPFKEIYFHQYDVFKKPVYSLKNWGKKDPVEALVKELFKSNTEEDKKLAFKLNSKKRIFVNVIVRGEEELGVRLWEFGPETYEKLLSIASQDDEYGDITDLVEGTDLKIIGSEASMKKGTRDIKYVSVTVTPKRKTSVLSPNKEQVKEWLENQKDPLEIYKLHSFEEIKQMLKEFMEPTSEDDDEDEKSDTDELIGGKGLDDESDDEEEDAPKVKSKTPTTKFKPTTKKDKIDEMFDED